jgi:hypothetical protein
MQDFGCPESFGRFCSSNNSVEIQSIELQFSFFVARIMRLLLLNLVIRLLRYDAAKISTGFFETQAWAQAVQGYPGKGPHCELVLYQNLIFSADLKFFE